MRIKKQQIQRRRQYEERSHCLVNHAVDKRRKTKFREGSPRRKTMLSPEISAPVVVFYAGVELYRLCDYVCCFKH